MAHREPTNRSDGALDDIQAGLLANDVVSPQEDAPRASETDHLLAGDPSNLQLADEQITASHFVRNPCPRCNRPQVRLPRERTRDHTANYVLCRRTGREMSTSPLKTTTTPSIKYSLEHYSTPAPKSTTFYRPILSEKPVYSSSAAQTSRRHDHGGSGFSQSCAGSILGLHIVPSTGARSRSSAWSRISAGAAWRKNAVPRV